MRAGPLVEESALHDQLEENVLFIKLIAERYFFTHIHSGLKSFKSTCIYKSVSISKIFVRAEMEFGRR